MRTTHTLILIILSVEVGIICGQLLDQTPITIEAVAGLNAILPCSVKDLGQHQVIFHKGTQILSVGKRVHTTDKRFTIHSPYENDWNLHIRGVKISDEGEYSCMIHRSNPPQKKTLTMVVQVSAEIIHEQSTRDLDILENENVTLQCVASGFPTPKYQWFFRKVGEAGDGDQIVNGGRGILVIYQIKRQQAGIYMCRAYNGVGPEDKKYIRVEVEYAPEITLLNAVQKQFLGKDTELHCNIIGHPLEKTRWMKDNYELPFTSFKYKQILHEYVDQPSVFSLEIRSLDRSDYGEYSCFAVNSYGSAKKSMVLVEAIPTTTTTTTTTTETPSTFAIIPSTTTPLSSSHNPGIIVDRNSSNSSKDPNYTLITTHNPLHPEHQETDAASGSFNVTAVYLIVALTCKLLTLS